jgi:hypothetical protein
LLLNANSAIFQLYHSEKKLIFTTTYVFSVYHYLDCIGGVLVKVIASSALDREFEQQSAQIKEMVDE